ncbi:hypothetical protein QAD02_015999 [Eretmocerus hayati]|uniref:Uncharacterized protein n=1 Tax=Eretmocerus hayati TaxID=131215 RepID=A0ACC2PA81_9HYME|nr:hypothetical protein QAD02_015999 [Eretmocerus hayati]
MESSKTPEAINIKPEAIKTAQDEMGRLDVLLCGQCHSVFHFIEDLQNHRTTENACSKVSNFRESSNTDQKAQVWAYLLWKGTQIQSDCPDKDGTSWTLYQKWCGLDSHIRDTWIIAGKTIQTFTKISCTNMLDVPQGSIKTESGKTVFIRKVTKNGQPDSWKVNLKSERIESPTKIKLKPSKISPGKIKPDEGSTQMETDGEEYAVEKILAKRFNPKKKVYEYLLKWEGYAHEHNSWEEVSQVSQTCKRLMEEFEKNLAKQKEEKAMQLIKLGESNKKVIKDSPKPGPSSSSGRPMRSSKSKAMDQVKQWCGSMNASESQVLGKRRILFSESDSDDGGVGGRSKRSKVDSSGDDWTADSDDDKIVIGQSDMIQRAFKGATGQSNGSNRNSLGGAQQNNRVITNKGVVKVDNKQSNVYIVHRKDGVIRLDSPPTNKIAVKGQTQTVMVQNRDGTIVRKQIITGNAVNNSVTPVQVIRKPDGSQVVTQMKVVSKTVPLKTTAGTTIKSEPVKIQPKPDSNQVQQIVVTALPSTLAANQRVVTQNSTAKNAIQRSADGQRPLLPRPTTNMRTSTPKANSAMNTSVTKTPLKTGSPAAQRQILPQKRFNNTTTIITSSPTSTMAARPSITVYTQQGKPLVKSPAQAMTKSLPRTQIPTGKNQSTKAVEQKMIAARRKVAEQAGVVPRTGQKVAAPTKTPQNKPKTGNEANNINKPKEKKPNEMDTSGIHMEFHQVESGESSGEDAAIPPLPAEPAPQPEPESPQQFTLCPLTGRIIGPDGVPIDPPEPEPQPPSEPTPVTIVQAQVPTATAQINADGTITTTIPGEGTELVLPNLESLTDSTGGMVRVEMSPGGTTGMIVQTSEAAPVMTNMIIPGPDLPCLDDPSVEIIPTSTANTNVTIAVNEAPVSSADGVVDTSSSNAPAATLVVTTADSNGAEAEVASTTEPEKMITGQEVTATNVKMEEHGGVVTITGDDGVLYQVTGQAEDGQTLLVTRAGDGEQQCVYVTTADQQTGEEGQAVLTLDNAVAEAVGQFVPDQTNGTPQYYVKQDGDPTTATTTTTTVEGAEGASADGQQVVMSIMDGNNTFVAAAPNAEDGDNQAQVVAQVIQADEPTPGGTRRVVLLLPDGNLMMTEVDEEQYAALELDK